MTTRRQLVCGVVFAGAGLMVRSRVVAGPVATDSIGDQVQTLPKAQLPDFTTHAPDAQRLYRYAVEDYDRGMTLGQMRRAIDARYRRRGPATPTPIPR